MPDYEPGVRSRFRAALQVALAAWFKANTQWEIEFVAGEITGKQERQIGCVWFDNKVPHRSDWNNEESFFGVRVFRVFAQDQGGEEPRASVQEHLEMTFEALEDALTTVINRPDLATAAPEVDLTGCPDYFIVTQIVLNRADQHITATIAAQLRNRTRKGG